MFETLRRQLARTNMTTIYRAVGWRFKRAARWTGRALQLLVTLIMTVLPATPLGVMPAYAEGSPALTADKADYAPGETVLLSGSGFDAGDYVLAVMLPDASIFSDLVAADEAGAFSYEYLPAGGDGTYEARAYPAGWLEDWGEAPLANVSFTVTSPPEEPTPTPEPTEEPTPEPTEEPTPPPVITTDKADYAPGETVTVFGSGFAPGASYDVPVIRPDGQIVTGDGTFTPGWDSIQADATGYLTYYYVLNGIIGTYEVRAYDAPWSGNLADVPLASSSFTDAGGSYSIDFAAADPNIYVPPIPFPGGPTCPTGTGSDPIANAYHTTPPSGPAADVESLAPSDMALGQIVPFEILISVSGSTTPEGGEISFTAGWNVDTTSNDDFGYDDTIGVLCAFVDTADGAHNDTGSDATVASFTSSPVGDEIQGIFDIGGLDDGDEVVVEVWVVLDEEIPSGANGNVQSRLISAETSLGDKITTGNQTVPLNKVQAFFTAEADLSVIKSDSPDPVTAGQQLTYSITVNNNSTDTVANGVEVTDTLDPNTTYVSGTWSGGTCSELSGDVTCAIGALSPGQSVTITLTVNVSPTAPVAGSEQDGTCTVGQTGVDLCNTVSVTAITDDPNTANNSDSEPTNVLAPVYPPDLTVLKDNDADGDTIFSDTETVPASASYPATVPYLVTITNNSSSDATITSVSDDTHDVTSLSCEALIGSTILAGETTTCSFDVIFDNADVASVTNEITVSASNDAGSDSDSDTSTVIFTQDPELYLVKTADPLIFTAVDEVISYSYLVTNSGNVSLAGPVTIDDDKATDESCPDVSSVGNFDGYLNPGESITCTASYTITQADFDAGLVTNTAIASADGTDSNPDDETVTVASGAHNPQIELVKTGFFLDDIDSDGFADVGETISYSFTVTNTGNVTLTNVTVSDPAVTVSGGPIASLAPGASDSTTFTGSYTITQADIDAGHFYNLATATGKDPSNADVTDDDSHDEPLPQNPAIQIVKSGSFNDEGTDGFGDAGETITYTYDVTNTGNQTLVNLSVTDAFTAPALDANLSAITCAPIAQGGTLVPGGTTQCTATYTLAQADVDEEQVANLADADADDPDGANVNDDDPETVLLPANPAIELVKIVTSSGPYDSEGDVIEYELVATNTGNVTLTNVSISDPLLGTLSCTPAQPTALAPEATLTCLGSYTLTQADIDVIGHLQWQNSGEEPFDNGGVWFIQGSDYPATGSGLIDSFVRIQAKDNEQGYNTDFRPQEFDEGNTATFNHSILVADVPVIYIDGQPYWEFRLDLNEHDNQADRDDIFLTSLRLFVADVGNLTDFDTATNTFGSGPSAELYDAGAINVQLEEWTSGSGHGDYTVLIPYEEGDYTGQYMYLYSAFSETDGGFEEWYLRKFGLLENTATATADCPDGTIGCVSDTASAEVVVSAEADYGIPEYSARIASATSSLAAAGVANEGAATVDNAIEYTVTIRNDGNVTLSNVVVTEQVEGGSPIILDNATVSGDDGNGKLDLGETWTYTYTRYFGEDGFDLNGDAKLTSVVTADSDETHPLSSSSEVDVSSMIFIGLAMKAHSADWWAEHLEAWDGDVDTDTWDDLVGSDLGMNDVLLAVDSNRDGSISRADAEGILLGDINANGLTDSDETTLFVPLSAAQNLIAAGDNVTDMRMVLMSEALAAQLNINNMSADSTGTDNPEGPNDIVSEAAMWLRGMAPYAYDDSTGNVDSDGDGSLSVGNNKNFEYNIKDDLFTGDADFSVPNTRRSPGQPLSSDLEAWQKGVDVDDTSADIQASGENLKDILQAFNDGHLVVDPHGGYAGWFDGIDVVDVQANYADAFWRLLSDHGVL